MFYNNHIATWMCGSERVVTLDGRETVEYSVKMTNEEYRIELNRIFSEIQENYKLRWFYLFVTEKTKGGN